MRRILGYAGKADITNCTNNAFVGYESKEQEMPVNPTSRFLGGITGYLQRGNITSCVNKGNVVSYRCYYGNYNAGGDIIDSALSGLNCYNASGGICGVAAQDGLIQKCYNIAKVDTYTSNTYKLFDLTTNSYSNTMSGGICGALYLSTQIKNCYNAGDIHSYVNRDITIISPDAGDSIFDSIMKKLDEMTPTVPFQNAIAYAAWNCGLLDWFIFRIVAYCFNTGKIQGDKQAYIPYTLRFSAGILLSI